MNIKQICEQVQQTFSFGEPWKWSEDAAGLLIPVLNANPVVREYLMFEEAKDQILLEDTGNIDIAKVVNKTDTPVFIRGGAILVGATQNRAFQKGAIIQPGKSEVPIRCVHASHTIREGASFKFANKYAPEPVVQALRSRRQDQVWASVSNFHAATSMQLQSSGQNYAVEELQNVRNDDLEQTLETVDRFKTDVDEAVRRMPLLENQVGVVIMTVDGVKGMEMFDSAESWKALRESVVKQYREVFEQKVPEYLSINMEKVASAINEFLGLAMESTEEKESFGTVVFRGKGVSGEYTVLRSETKTDNARLNGMMHSLRAENGLSLKQVIHLVISKETQQPEPKMVLSGSLRATPSQSSIDPIWERPQETTYKGNPYPQYTQYTHSSNFLNLLSEIQEKPKTWRELEPEFKSTSTLHRLTTNGIEKGFIQKTQRENGKPLYVLTAKGQEALKKSKTTD